MWLGIVLAVFGLAAGAVVSALLLLHSGWAALIVNSGLAICVVSLIACAVLVGRDLGSRARPETHVPDARIMWLYDVLRYLSHQSKWAAIQPVDDKWITTLNREFVAKLSLGALQAHGRRYKPTKEYGPRRIHPDFWCLAEIWGLDCVMRDNSTAHAIHSGVEAYTEIFFDRRDVLRVWPKRSRADRAARRSPAEAWGFVEDWAQEDAKNDALTRRIKDDLAQRLNKSSLR